MWYILIGLVGFGFIAAAEYSSQKQVGLLKPLLWLMSIACLLYALIMGWVDSPRFAIPLAFSRVALVSSFAFGGLFLYSAFLEVPFRSSYMEKTKQRRLVTGGTYALVRHPGVLWSIGWLLSVVLVSRSLVLAMAVPFWVAANISCVYLEEKVNLEKAFGEEHKEYQKVTPMFIPTKASLLRFFRIARSRILPHDD